MRNKLVLALIGLLLSSQTIYAGEIFSEDFDIDPGWISTEPSNIKWDPAGFYRARVTDNPSGFVQWGSSPVFEEISNSSFTLEFDINPVDPSWGTYPLLGLVAEGVQHPFGDIPLSIGAERADEFPNNFVMRGKPYGSSSPIYFSSPVFTVGEWYHQRVDYDAASDTLRWKISLVGMPDGSFYSNTYTDISVAPFNQVVVGYESTPPVYGSWAEIYVDNIVICVAEPAGPVAYWSFGNPSDPGHDDSGNGHNGTLYGDISVIDGICAKALYFDGNGDFVDVPDADALDPASTQEITIAAWVNIPTYEAQNASHLFGIVGKSAIVRPDGSYLFGIQNNHVPEVGKLRLAIATGNNATFQNVYSSSLVPTNRWVHVAVTHDSSNITKIYINGQIDTTDSSAITQAFENNDKNLTIGYSGRYADYFYGSMDEVRIYDRALSACEVVELMSTCLEPHSSSWWKTTTAEVLVTILSHFMQERATVASIKGITCLSLQLYPAAAVLLGGQAMAIGLEFYLYQLVSDPPDPNYDEVYTPQVPYIPLEGLDELGPETASFLQKRVDLRSKLLAYLKALLITMEREAGARAAGDQLWLEAQQDAFGRYSRIVQSLIAEIALTEQDANSVLTELGIPSSPIELSDIEDFQQYLADYGLPEDELYILSLFGIQPNDIQERIDAWIALDPCGLVGTTIQDVFSEAEIYEQFLSVFPEPDIDVSPLSHDFGDVELGTSSTVIVTISNLGNGDLTVSSIALETDFAITSVPTASIVVEPNETKDVEITYTPSALGYNSAVLKITSDDPDEPVVEVQLGAVGIEIPPPPSEQIANILAFFDESVEEGTLQGRGRWPCMARLRLKAFRHMIKAGGDLIDGEWYRLACLQLRRILLRCDDGPWPPDFVQGEAVPQLASMVQELRDSLGCK